ncbi:MAG TPA: C40 family peptidase [Bacteroidales bacterium]|nr:C40 family peptidase [Bacteroidales bacterium]
MQKGICLLSVVPIRSEPSDVSEIVSQLLFGEMFQVAETMNSWLKIVTVFDAYEGWIDAKQCCFLTEDEFQRLNNDNTSVVTDVVQLICNTTLNLYFPIVMGSSLPAIVGKNMTIAGNDYVFDAEYTRSPEKLNGAMITEYTMQYLNSPYLWGGRSPFGIDCSGFTQIIMKLSGVRIARDAAQQALQGKPVDFVSEAMPGDLAYFENSENNIIHTGIILFNQKIIHASGKVRIDEIDHEGIFNNDLHSYTHKLRCIRRFV